VEEDAEEEEPQAMSQVTRSFVKETPQKLGNFSQQSAQSSLFNRCSSPKHRTYEKMSPCKNLHIVALNDSSENQRSRLKIDKKLSESSGSK